MQEYAYLFLGGDEVSKNNKIESIKNSYLDKSLKDIDFEIIYSDDRELSPPRFNETLSYLPLNSLKKKIILVKNIELLDKDNRGVLIKYLNNPCNSILLLLDGSQLDANDSFAKELSPFVKSLYFKSEKKIDVFDLAQAIVQRNTTRSLEILNLLLNNREKAHGILGGLFWQWDSIKDKLNTEVFKQGLNILVDADSKIKTGKLAEKLALEMLVIRLCSLL